MVAAESHVVRHARTTVHGMWKPHYVRLPSVPDVQAKGSDFQPYFRIDPLRLSLRTKAQCSEAPIIGAEPLETIQTLRVCDLTWRRGICMD